MDVDTLLTQYDTARYRNWIRVEDAPIRGVIAALYGTTVVGVGFAFFERRLLPKPTKVAEMWLSPAFVCRFIGTIPQQPMSYDHRTWRRNVPPRVLETHLFRGQKVKGHEAEKTRNLVTYARWLQFRVFGSYTKKKPALTRVQIWRRNCFLCVTCLKLITVRFVSVSALFVFMFCVSVLSDYW